MPSGRRGQPRSFVGKITALIVSTPMDSEPADIPEHESPVRRMMADAYGTPFYPLRTLEEAREHDDGVAILQGDWGGQIYAVIPAAMIRCSAEKLHQLLLDVDSEAWSCNENEGASIYYERKPSGSGVAGGMGGGASTGDLWVHPEFAAIVDQVRAVIDGQRDSISPSDVEERIKQDGPHP